MYELPTSVTTKDGRVFHITDKGDYRVVLKCFVACDDMELASEDESVLACLLIFYNEFNDFDDLTKIPQDTLTELAVFMFNFFNCGQTDVGCKTEKKVIDWEQDEQIITAAINNVAKAEIRSLDYLHWYTFMGYYLSVGESVLSTVVSIRSKINKGKKLEKDEQQFRRDNPHYFNYNNKTRKQREDEEYIRSIWNGGNS